MIIRKQLELFFMLMSFPAGAALWFYVFYFLKGDYVAIHKLAKQGFYLSLVLISISKAMTKTKDDGDDCFSLVDILALLVGWVGIALSMGVIVFYFYDYLWLAR